MAEQRSIRQLRAELDLIRQESEHSKDIAMNLSQYFKTQKDISKLHEQINKQQALWNKINESANESLKKTKKLLGEELKEEEKILSDLEDQLDIVGQQMRMEKSRLAQMGNQLTLGNLIKSGLGSILSITQELTGIGVKQELSFVRIGQYLIEQQKSLKQLNLQLGISGEKSDFMRKSLQDAAFQTQVLGIGIKELTELQAGLSSEVGFVKIYTTEQLEALSQIAASTKLGTTETAKMVGMYENLGISILGTHEQVQNILDQSERMGTNTQNVMNSITKNFKAAQKFYFKGGVASMSKMAIFAEKWKLSMESTLESMDKARTLEGVVEMTQNLRVLGGEFSKLDPFKILYQSRNEGDKFQETIKNLTKGTAFFNKELGQFQVSAIGMDVLREASKALGIPLDELKTTAIRVSEIDMMAKSMPGFARMDKELKEIIESQAKWNKENERFEITDPFNPDRSIAIRNITKEQLKSFQAGQKSLEERAKQAIAFDDAFKNLVNTIKAAFLPLISGLNTFTSWIQDLTKGLGKVGSVVTVLGTALIGLFASKLLFSSLSALSGGIGNLTNKLFGISKATTLLPKGGLVSSLFGPKFSAGAMLKGAAAMVLVGASLIPFAYAMTLLKDVGWKQFGLIAAGIGLMTAAVVGLGAIMATGFGAAAIVLGAGAIALMGASLIPLAYSMKELGEANIPDIGFGFQTLSSSVNAIDSSKLEEIQKTAEALRNLSVTAGLFGGLGKLFADGIEVKFKDNQVQMVANITAQLDKDVLVRKLSEPISVEIESGNAFIQRKLGT